MVRLFLVFLLLVWGTGASGQRLYYFSKDGKTGVRDGAGRVIIPAVYGVLGYESGDTVEGDIIYLLAETDTADRPGYNTPFAAYNRQGELLFYPFFYDNGPDYLSEGLFRIVKDQKIGFANRHGEIVIPPQFSFALPFMYGLSFFCNDCRFYRDSLAGPEHNLRLTSGGWGVIGRDGKVLLPAVPAKQEKVEDRELAGFVPPGITADRLDVTDSLLARLPPLFLYTPEEHRLLQRLQSLPQLGSAISYNLPADARPVVKYEIIERPGSRFPYYWVKAFQVIRGVYYNAEEDFLLSPDGKELYSYTPLTGRKEKIIGWQERTRMKR